MNHSSSEHGGLVLIVDDMPRNLQILSGILNANRFETVVAGSGEAALALVASRAPDLVLLDLMMPGTDGMEVCRRLKGDSRTASIPVVFLTAASEADIAADAISLGAVDYVTKPFNTAELLARVRTHVALKRTRDELHTIISQKNELMSAVAHDLKNPISAARFSALLLREQGLVAPDPRAELVDDIVQACDGALAFIQDRLERSARDARLEYLTIREVDMVDVVNVVVNQNLSAAAKKRIELRVEFPEDELIRVQGDHEALCRALSNLVSNAVKFSPCDRKVVVSVAPEPAERRVCTRVVDQGPGLTEEDRKHLFTPFRRLSAAPTAGESSTGLGLNIARQLVEKMNGAIGHESPADGGACFWICIPSA